MGSILTTCWPSATTWSMFFLVLESPALFKGHLIDWDSFQMFICPIPVRSSCGTSVLTGIASFNQPDLVVHRWKAWKLELNSDLWIGTEGIAQRSSSHLVVKIPVVDQRFYHLVCQGSQTHHVHTSNVNIQISKCRIVESPESSNNQLSIMNQLQCQRFAGGQGPNSPGKLGWDIVGLVLICPATE